MKNRPTSRRGPRKRRNALRRLATWGAARRRLAVALALRGACYGAGTGAVGLITFVVERHL